MLSSNFPGALPGPDELPEWLRGVGWAFLYWVVFLVALEPGNILHASRMGHALEFGREALRIVVAALLGCSTAPVILALGRRFPVSGPRALRSIAIHAAGAAAMSFVLILVSCVLAAWVLLGQTVPTSADIRSQLAANWLLLTFALCAFGAVSHAMKTLPPPARGRAPADARTVAIKTRGRLGYLDLCSIEWIETQGNYLALHVGGQSHLVRDTLLSFSRRLDPGRFMRVHRRVIVAIDRIREIEPLANGDSSLLLEDGCTIRASRRYREDIRRRWAEIKARPSASAPPG